MDWHNITDPEGPDLDRLAERYRLHPLHVEDCRHRNQVAKIEEGDGYLFTVMKTLRVDEDGCIRAGDLDLFLGPDFLITVLEEDCPEVRALVEPVRKALQPQDRADQAYYRVLDSVVDSYFPVLDHFDEMIDGLEDQALEEPAPRTLATIFEAKRNLVLMRRVLANTRDVASRLLRADNPLIQRDLWPFFRDLYDHVTRNFDNVEMLRDLLNGALDVYLSAISNRTNQVMKVLTVLGTVALPALVISGIYGMNVHGLPGAESPHGIVIALGGMAAGTFLLLFLLRRFGWF